MASNTNKKKQTKRTNQSNSKKVTGKKKIPAVKNESSFLKDEIIIWLVIALGILCTISNFGLAGFVGDKISSVLIFIFGWVAYVFPICLFGGVAFTVSNKGNSTAYIKTTAGIILTVLCCLLLQMINDRGGWIGSFLSDMLVPAIGTMGTIVVSVILAVICIVIMTEKSVIGGMKKGSAKAYSKARIKAEYHRKESEERRSQQRIRQEELKRSDRTVSGVSFNTTLEKAEDNNLTDEIPKKKMEKKSTKKTSIPEVMLEEKPKQISMDEVVINRAMPVSVTELTPEIEQDVTDEMIPTSTIDSTPSKETEKVDIKKEIADVEETIKSTKEPVKEYKSPPLSLLKHGRKAGGDSDVYLRETAMKLQQTLQTFGVNVTVTNISCGPSVTRYELQPEMGVKVSKIVGLADDIKLNLAAADIRIEAPIPGKAAVGIEVPNKENSAVMLRDLLESQEFKDSRSKISFATGKDIAGQVVVSDIAKMPHVLIAGATGSGKSVCINTLIMSILYKAKPEEVKLIMIDPKVVELSVYNGIPHLMIPVVTDPKKAAGALNWAVAEMTKRYQMFAEYNVRDIKGYNAKVEAIKDIEDPNKPEAMPQIVIIVDELADLMMVAPGEVEEAICRLAQLARAAGIHLVLATQRPSVNVITGLIKANMPSRIAFSVSSGVDSRTIIDMNGAEKLLGKGDMLFYPSGYQKPVRVQGAFVSDKEVQMVVEFLKENSGQITYDEEIQNQVNSNLSLSGAAGQGASGERDAYFVDAGKFIIEKDKASIGMLQRVFKIGFNRAARIMDQLYDAGVVGEEEGTKPRKVLMSIEEFEQYIDEYV